MEEIMNQLKSIDNKIVIKPYSPNFGGIVTGVDLSKEISDQELGFLKDAFNLYQVLFFQEQSEIPPHLQVKLGKSFGPLHVHPAAPTMDGHPEIFEIHTHKDSKISNGTENFHSDVSCDIEPPLGTMLQLHILPECGGDTMFVDMYSAYNNLSKPMKSFLGSLSAWHESEHIYKGRYAERGVSNDDISYPSSLHPMIRTHPETKRKALFVNRSFTTRIEGLTKEESNNLLKFLFDHSEQIAFQIRYRWNKNDMAFWDNRCALHKAIWDYHPMERKGRRVTIKGDRPV
jgi:taurine dioxygenase|tara:strand:- start:956 stop:1816 length:861 start_codon:yes stop_codon:yes gene_type:complete